MTHSNLPITPERIDIFCLAKDTDSSILDGEDLDRIDCSPATKTQINALKRKASQLSEEGSPNTTSPFLKWRLAVVESKLRVRNKQREALNEASPSFYTTTKPKEEWFALLKQDEKALLKEKTFILSKRQILEEDLNDLVTSKVRLEEAYITELRMSLQAASSTKYRKLAYKVPRLERTVFQNLVNEYLGTKISSDTGSTRRWCSVLACWLPRDEVKCAHIIPFSWNTKDMAYMFGGDEPPLTSKRNGLSLQTKIEQAFDDCWVTIVPVDSVECTPTRWKILLLNTSQANKTFFCDMSRGAADTGQEYWRWQDIDGRELKFLNDNRPARRFLYMRYALAWLTAEDKSWESFKERVPPGEVWTSPNKPDGYLRKSVFLGIHKRLGDKLPNHLIHAGIFEDPDTSSIVDDELAKIRITEHVENHIEGARDEKEVDTEEESDEGEYEEGDQ